MAAEKRGNTGKLDYNFDPCDVTEVKLKSGRWHRVTCRVFRSWDGPRRIKKSTNMYESHTTEFRDYFGPTYQYDTNFVVEPDGRCDIRWEDGYVFTPDRRARHRK